MKQEPSPRTIRPNRAFAADAVGVTVVAGALFLLWREVIFASHMIITGDLYLPFRMDALLARFVTFWNPVLEFPNVETMDRLAWVAPFLPLGDPATIQLAMITVVVVGSGLAMYAACRRLGAPVVIAVLAGVVYGCNPWIANRVQHVFILPGYAVLPLVAALWIRPLRRRTVLWLVLLLGLGSGTPHTTAALWGVSIVLVAVRPTRTALRRFGLVAFWYAMLNLYWLVPTLAFMGGTGLVPSWPTWELVEQFSRHADPASVVALGGYWWPLGPFDGPAWTAPLGLGLAVAFLASLRRWSRERIVLVGLAVACAVVALGTNAAWAIGPLVLEGPLADRFGWLLRDPNKAVGPLAAFLLLVIAGAAAPSAPSPSRRLLTAATVLSLGGYLVYAVPRVTGYVDEVYDAHALPEAFRQANAWLDGRGGRAAWIPEYFGARTFWNDGQLTPAILAASSSVPVLSPYVYDARARRAFMTLDFGGTLGDLPIDVGTLMRRWGVRWLVHHRDVLPYRLQEPGTFDNRVETRPVRLAQARLEEAVRFEGVTIYDAGPAMPAGPVEPLLAQRPTATAAALSNFGDAAFSTAVVGDPHPRADRVVSLPGDEPRLLWAEGQVRVPLAPAAPHAAPGERWSRFTEAAVTWWPLLAPRGGPPPEDAGAVVATSRPGAVLRARAAVEPGRHHLLVRVYRARTAGTVRVRSAQGGLDEVLELRSRAPGMEWRRAGTLNAPGGTLEVSLENLAGTNVVADMRLVPEASWRHASERVAAMDASWAWTRPPSCPAEVEVEADAAPLPFSARAEVPWTGTVGAEGAWSAVDAIELELVGDGSPRDVEVWTRADDVWVRLGAVHVGWRGARTIVLPVERSSFASAPRGAEAPATLLRVLPAGGADGSGGGVRLMGGRLLRERTCGIDLHAAAAGRFSLLTAGDSAPFPVVVDGERYEVAPSRPLELDLSAGDHRLDYPEGVPRSIDAFWLLPALPPVAVAAGAPETVLAGPALDDGSGGADGCPAGRALWRTQDRYVDGMTARVGDARAQVVSVDGLLAGVWLPPDVCGTPELNNPWRPMGRTSLIASLVAASALGVVAVLRPLP